MQKSRTRNDAGLPARLKAGLPASRSRGDRVYPPDLWRVSTIIELLVAIALGMVILAGLFRTFKVQQDSYVMQDQISGHAAESAGQPCT